MKRVVLSLLVSIGIFVLVEAIAFGIGVVILTQGATLDPNGITSTPSPSSEHAAATLTQFATIAGVVLALIGGIVFGVQKGGGDKAAALVLATNPAREGQASRIGRSNRSRRLARS